MTTEKDRARVLGTGEGHTQSTPTAMATSGGSRACYDCVQHRDEVPGSAHSSCQHPAMRAVHADPMAGLIGLLGRRSGMTGVACASAARELNIVGVEQGIRNGWFIWPVNFDPVWLKNCDGFTAKADPHLPARDERS